MRKNSTPAQRVGRAANVTIFLGILFTVIHLLALGGVTAMAQRGYGLPGLIIAVGFLGLGYGIRYGSYAAFYLAIGGFAALGAYFATRFAITGEPAMLLRCVVTAWAAASLCRAIPDMRTLRQNAAFPLPMSRYGAFFCGAGATEGKRQREKQNRNSPSLLQHVGCKGQPDSCKSARLTDIMVNANRKGRSHGARDCRSRND